MTKPTKAALKALPKFDSEAAERAYWESHDSTSIPSIPPPIRAMSLISRESKFGCKKRCTTIEDAIFLVQTGAGSMNTPTTPSSLYQPFQRRVQ